MGVDIASSYKWLLGCSGRDLDAGGPRDRVHYMYMYMHRDSTYNIMYV